MQCRIAAEAELERDDMTPHDPTLPDPRQATADPSDVRLPSIVSIDITAYLPAPDSEPTA